MTDKCPWCHGTGLVEATFASRLLALRQHRGVTQEVVAQAAHVSRAQIANLERGRGEMSVQSLIRLAEFYGVTTDYILGRSTASKEA